MSRAEIAAGRAKRRVMVFILLNWGRWKACWFVELVIVREVTAMVEMPGHDLDHVFSFL